MYGECQYKNVPVKGVEIHQSGILQFNKGIAQAFVKGILPSNNDDILGEVFYIMEGWELEIRVKIKVADGWAEVPIVRIPPQLWKSKITC